MHPQPDRIPSPLAELHLHLEGTLEPELIFELARRNGVTLPYRDLDDLRARYRFRDLQSFLDLYYANMATLRTAADFERLTWAYAERAHAGGVRHAEVFVDPQAHTARGVPTETVLRGVAAGLERAESELGLTSGIIVCVLRDRPVAEARRMLEESLAAGVPLLGIGLDSAEVGYPPSLFADVFAAAAEAGLRRVAHAGEEGPPEYLWQALDVLGVERVDHGVRCLEDDVLVRRLAAEQVPLTVCPLSNVRLRVVDDLAAHPLRRMLDRGLLVTLNSDDPAYFGGYVDDNLRQCRDTLGLTGAELATLAANSVRASFAGAGRKAELLARLG
ncbi:adenosine deaminase [Prauserella flavalba]|uniref:adenosine deaminase n=1 Tax=Prauserella flavalba TaxID=1477506 RepID=UPI0036E844E9